MAAEPLSHLAIRAAATNPLGIYMICTPAGAYLVAPLNPPAGMTPEQQYLLPVIVQPGAWLTDINFGYK